MLCITCHESGPGFSIGILLMLVEFVHLMPIIVMQMYVDVCNRFASGSNTQQGDLILDMAANYNVFLHCRSGSSVMSIHEL